MFLATLSAAPFATPYYYFFFFKVKMACRPHDLPPNLIGKVGKVRRWAPEPTKLEKWCSLLVGSGYVGALSWMLYSEETRYVWHCAAFQQRRAQSTCFLPATMVGSDKAQPRRGGDCWEGEADTQRWGTVALVQGYPPWNPALGLGVKAKILLSPPRFYCLLSLPYFSRKHTEF